MMDQLKEWWPQTVAAIGMFASFIAGRERTRQRISEVKGDVAQVQTDVKSLQASTAAQDIKLATMMTDLKWLKANMEGRK